MRRCTQLEAQAQQLHTEASEARSQLTNLVKAQDQLRADTDKRLAAAKQAAAAEREAMQARHAAKIKKLQEAAKDQVRFVLSGWVGGYCAGASKAGNGGSAGGATGAACGKDKETATSSQRSGQLQLQQRESASRCIEALLPRLALLDAEQV